MPVPVFSYIIQEGVASIPHFWSILKVLPWLALVWLIKRYMSGAINKSERKMNGKVVIVTGGTSGVGAAVVRDLAGRGAQIVLLTQHPLNDPFIVEHIEDLRRDTSNELITAEQVDMSSLHSIRTFATKWIDNAPPRRLDMLVLCANTMTFGDKVHSTLEGVESNWQINYLANFHLMSILSPALRAQPPDRDVRVLFGNCSSYVGGDLLHITNSPKSTQKSGKKSTPTSAPTKFSPANAYATSKLALATFAIAFQKHLATYKRPDDFPMNTRVMLVDPGFCRTPGTRRWLTGGSLIGLVVYMLSYPLWWILLKSPEAGAQSFLYAAMEERFGRGEDAWSIKECTTTKYSRDDVQDESVQKQLWEYSERMVEDAEKRGAAARAQAKKESKDRQEEDEAAKELKDYKDKVGKQEGNRKAGSRRNRKGG